MEAVPPPPAADMQTAEHRLQQESDAQERSLAEAQERLLQIEERVVEPGEEVSFILGGNDVPRAVKYEIKVTDGHRMEVRTVNGGPHPLG